MSLLTLFGLFAVTAMVVCYALEARHERYVLLFAFSCLLGSAYGFLQGAWPFGAVELVWSGIAARRWWLARRHPQNEQVAGRELERILKGASAEVESFAEFDSPGQTL